jgi:hypothetical protein
LIRTGGIGFLAAALVAGGAWGGVAAASADPSPVVSGLSVSSGMPGTVVGVSGTGFLTGCAAGQSPSVFFGISQLTPLSGATDTLLHFQVPVARNGFYDVAVQDCAGDVSTPTSASQFTLTLPPPPKVTSVSPKTGTVGTTITVAGTGFRLYCTDGRIPNVTFDNPDVFGDEVTVTDGDPQVVSWTDTKIVLHAPAHPAALVDILPHDCTGRSTAPSTADTFTYLAPKVSRIAPATGTIGTLVAITGTGFLNGCAAGQTPAVQFGSTLYASGDPAIQSASATKVTVLAPSAPAGKVDVRVVDCLGDASAVVAADKYTYKPPTVTGVSPAQGHAATLVTVKGTGFLTGCTGGALPSVLVGTVLVPGGDPSIGNVTSTSLQIAMPAHAAGTVDVHVIDCVGDKTAVAFNDKFKYL